MEKAGGEVPQNLKQSFLATLSDPQVTLLSVHKRWSLKRSPGARGSARMVSLEEEGSFQSEKAEFPQRVLNGTRVSSSQVNAIAEGLNAIYQ